MTANLFADLPADLPAELTHTLAAGPGVRVERIVSRGHSSPPGFWYDQDEHELVILIQGHARVAIEGEGELDLSPGDWLDLPAHSKHRVTFTDPHVDTIWLAVFSKA